MVKEEAATKAPAARGAAPGASAPTHRREAGGPGARQMTQRRRRQKSRYGVQMEEKQNLKKIYGIREKQLRRYYSEALAAAAQTGDQIVVLLEKRLDNAVFRAGFAETRGAARQMAGHRLLTVNGRPVNIPSIRLTAGDVVSVKEAKRGKAIFKNFETRLQGATPPAWIELDKDSYSFKVLGEPVPAEANIGVDVRAIVEYFAR